MKNCNQGSTVTENFLISMYSFKFEFAESGRTIPQWHTGHRRVCEEAPREAGDGTHEV